MLSNVVLIRPVLQMSFPFSPATVTLQYMTDVAISATRLSTSYTVQTADLNGYNVLHGGRLLTLADEVGFLAAHGFCNRDCLTVAVHRARFHRPCLVGELIHLQAQVGLTGNSSIWVLIEVSNDQHACVMDAVIVYSAVDKQRHPVKAGHVRAATAQEEKLQQYMRQLKLGIAQNSNETHAATGQL
ncbi:MAG: acyl-CoA thioesterase [Mariprofundaceae bacterium]|nr:acyl-CoA thioesterase [Mariprofundaceae bacterium]